MSFDGKYWTVVIISILLVTSMFWVVSLETAEKMKEMEEIAAGPRGDIVFKKNCGSCHQFDITTHGKLNLGNVGERLDAEALKSFIQLPPAPMTEWEGSPVELDKLIEYLIAGPPAGEDEPEKEHEEG